MRTEIQITVSGGLIQHMTGIPSGVVVTVRDYDCEQSDDEAVMDADGEFCVMSTWDAES
jgi:hypothetical protein